MKITNIVAREIFDSRGLPTIECQIMLDSGIYVVSSVPSGLSRGNYEVCELRDGGTRLLGLGVEKAREHIENIIAPALIGKEPDMVATDLYMIDLDGTEDKSRLGGNAILAVSIAMCKAQAASNDIESFELIADLCEFDSVTLPVPMFNLISGGVHANNNLMIQEFMIIPTGRRSYRLCLEAAVTVFHQLKYLLQHKGKSLAIGDEGAFAPDLEDEREALDLIMEAIHLSNDEEGEFVIALDVAASQFYDLKQKIYSWDDKKYTTQDLIGLYEQLTKEYPIYAIEDGLSDTDWDGWVEMRKQLGDDIHLIGDDIFATNPYRIAQGIEEEIADTTIIKPNQIGTITETLQAIKLCKEHNMNIIASHRSGETNDTFIVDLAVGVSANHIKAGGCCRGERMAKYNQLLRIEDTLMFSLLDV